MRTTLEFKVTGEQTIHCVGCEQRIANAIRRLPGIQAVRASAKTQVVQVVIDPAQVDAGHVQTKLQQLGYEVVRQSN